MNPRILVRAPQHLGDACLSSCAVQHLRGRFPSARLEVLCPEAILPLYAAMQHVDEIFGFKPHATGSLEIAHSLRGRRYDATLLLAPSLRAAFDGMACGSPIRVGVAWDGRSRLLTHSLATRGPRPLRGHQADLYLDLAELACQALGAPRAAQVRAAPALTLPPPSPVVSSLLNPLQSTATLHPGSAGSPTTRRWPEEGFVQIGRRLVASGLQVLVVGGAQEGALAHRVAARIPEARAVAGEEALGLQELVALLGRVQLHVGNDSGPAHLAAALGTPTVTLFGSTVPEISSPIGPWTGTVWKPQLCSGCYADTCEVGLKCWGELSVEEVWVRIQLFLRAPGEA